MDSVIYEVSGVQIMNENGELTSELEVSIMGIFELQELKFPNKKALKRRLHDYIKKYVKPKKFFTLF